jgi:hypothetical protein
LGKNEQTVGRAVQLLEKAKITTASRPSDPNKTSGEEEVMATLTTEVRQGSIATQTPRLNRRVRYVGHGRDADGDLILYFVDPCRSLGSALLRSSPIVGLRRMYSAVMDLLGAGAVSRYVIHTCNTSYEVQVPPAVAEQLAREVGTPLPGR